MYRTGSHPDSDLPFEWEVAIPRLVHPLKVTIIEALLWIGTPLSAKELSAAFQGQFSVGMVSHHIKGLAAVGLLSEVGNRPVRGAIQRFYFFPGQAWEPGSGWLEPA
jgi:hypothetical protein